MGRELPVLSQAAKDAPGQRTFWLMDVFLKASGDYAAESLYFSTEAADFGGHYYDPRLRGKPGIKYTLGGGTDGGSTKIDNTDLEIGQKILPKERFVEGSSVIIYFARKVADGTVEADKVFDGEIGSAKLSMSDGGVTLSLYGDIYKPTAVLGAFPLAQRCVALFPVGGLVSPDESICGWQLAQGGDPTGCDHTEDGPNGCSAHFNLHRFLGIPFFANVVVQIVAGGSGVGSSGFPSVGPNRGIIEIEPVYNAVY